MNIDKDIVISINYKLKDENIWHELSIRAQDYYDKDYYDENEEIEIDSLPLYDHAVDYIPLENKEMIRNTKIIIKDKETNEKIVIKETYWNSQKNSIAERIDIDNKGETSNHEIIVTTIVQDRKDEKTWEIIRFSEADDIFNLDFHSFITENEEKFISEDIVSKN